MAQVLLDFPLLVSMYERLEYGKECLCNARRFADEGSEFYWDAVLAFHKEILNKARKALEVEYSPGAFERLAQRMFPTIAIPWSVNTILEGCDSSAKQFITRYSSQILVKNVQPSLARFTQLSHLRLKLERDENLQEKLRQAILSSSSPKKTRKDAEADVQSRIRHLKTFLRERRAGIPAIRQLNVSERAVEYRRSSAAKVVKGFALVEAGPVYHAHAAIFFAKAWLWLPKDELRDSTLLYAYHSMLPRQMMVQVMQDIGLKTSQPWWIMSGNEFVL
ncbi:hypothetical protein DL96DRAFT_1716633 [Flagelloscypha sp. PMI_526]|nr:hypothetical protein DL96DRAFT_1716633 [Flagelloscypha sp. PMI_526]